MDRIYYEQQEGALCAVHCLNNLLQGQYFTAVDLAQIASRLDNAESHYFMVSHTTDQQRPSENMDDTGMFSVHVIEAALQSFDLKMVNLESQEDSARLAKDSPTLFDAYVCNYEQHWLTLRKVRDRWYNLDSNLDRPDFCTDTYLSLFIKQLSTEGYSIFLIVGQLPRCPADSDHPSSTAAISNNDPMPNDLEPNDDEQLQAAIALSLQSEDNS